MPQSPNINNWPSCNQRVLLNESNIDVFWFVPHQRECLWWECYITQLALVGSFHQKVF